MHQITIPDEAFLIFKNALLLQEKLTDIKLKEYQSRLGSFEQKYGMPSDRFYQGFGNGTLGDEEDWYDWLFVYEGYKRTLKKMSAIQGVKL